MLMSMLLYQDKVCAVQLQYSFYAEVVVVFLWHYNVTHIALNHY